MRDPGGQAVDVAVGAVELIDQAADPGFGQVARRRHQMAIERGQQAQVQVGDRLAKIRYPADFPQKLDRVVAGGQFGDFRHVGERAQR